MRNIDPHKTSPLSEPAAFEELFRSEYPGLHRFATSLVGDRDAAKDIVQEVFFRLWKRRATLDRNRSLRSLLFTSVRNMSFNYSRTKLSRESALSTFETDEPTTDHSDDIDAQSLGLQIRAWIDEMPNRRREAFQLSRFEGLTYEEIGRVMGLSARTVERHIQLALETLRSRLNNHDPGVLES